VASDYCYGIEMKLALERHARHDAIAIPVILRPVDWSTAPFAHLQALPRDGRAITTWSNRDEALAEVARGKVPFVCSETHELGEELVASYLYQVHLHHWLECNDYGRFLIDDDI
jgi:hypothetical protein